MTSNAVAWNQLREDIRSNQAREFETNRHNLRSEQETQRSNLANESINRGKIYSGFVGDVVKAIF